MRHDLYISNDAGGYSILSASVASRVIEDDRQNDLRFVQDHEVILQSLVGDDSFVARVVVDEPLTQQEQDEWIARVCWPLRVPCGKLLVCGGYDPDVIADLEEDETAFVSVPPGEYWVEVLTYLNTMNGRVLRETWGEDGLLGAWFRRDHPSRAFPSWVAAELVRFPNEDPGHEAEWRALADSVKAGKLQVETFPLNWVGVVVNLLPKDTDAEGSAHDAEGWFPENTGLRRPSRFPLGLATDVDDHDTHYPLEDILPSGR